MQQKTVFYTRKGRLSCCKTWFFAVKGAVYGRLKFYFNRFC